MPWDLALGLPVLAAGLSVLADVMSSIVLVWRFWSERTARGHADKFWAVALACQKERTASGPRGSPP